MDHERIFKHKRVPETTQNTIKEEVISQNEEDLRQLFLEFAQEDIELTEMGMDEYNMALKAEDIG